MFALSKTPQELKEEAAIAARRQREAERMSRFFDTKARTMGMDYGALDQLVAEKKKRAEAERASDAAFAAMALENEAAIMAMAAQEQAARRAKLQQDEEYRRKHQQRAPEPKETEPIRIGDYDPRLGASSLQVFEGEDLAKAERDRAQREQMRDWVAAAASEHQRQQAQEEQMAALEAMQEAELAAHIRDLMAADAAAKTRSRIEARETNRLLMQAEKERERRNRQAELQQSLAHMQHEMTSDLLTENPLQGRDAATGRIVSVDRFKGFLPQELHRVLDEQGAQAIEREMRREQFAAEERAAAKAALDVDRAVQIEARRQQRLRAEQQRLVAQTNARLAETQRSEAARRNAEFTSNAPTPAFFDQFNRSTR